MTVSRDVILDLLPVYLAGEGSPATRELVEAFLKEDPELAQRVRLQWAENFQRIAPSSLPPELELKSLSRTRALLGWQRWCFGFAIAFTSIAFSTRISFDDHWWLTEVRPLILDQPGPFGLCLGVGVAFWAVYLVLRGRLHTRAF
jgi:hypothetical protein